MYRVMHAHGEQNAMVSGKFSYEVQTISDYPTVGDFVMLSAIDTNSPAVIHAVLPRTSVFVRKAAGTAVNEQVVAANIDIVFICMSLGNDFNIRRLERYLSIAWESGASPVIVLTKADLCDDIAQKQAQAASAAMGAEILITSGLTEDGCTALLPYLQTGQTVVFIGSSGVGKSSLINRLLQEDRMKTGGLRNDEKGRHTTTHRQMLLLPTGGIVIDTPGMRELGMWDSADGLERVFSDIEELSRSCRFRDCTHTNEPDCAVRAAMQNGTLSQARWLSYQKLTAENAYTEDAQGYLTAKNKKFKDIAKKNKSNRKR